MESAAKKIQAVYRGYNVRQNLRSWQLPSGRTLHQTLEEGRRRAFLTDINAQPSIPLTSDHREPVKLPPKSIPRNISPEDESGNQNMASMIAEALESSKISLENAGKTLSSISRASTGGASKVGIVFLISMSSVLTLLYSYLIV